jgi:hypothetical protein
MDALLDPLIRFAQEMLAKRGEFYPVAAAMTSAGAVEMIGGAVEGEEHPLSKAVIDALYEGLAEGASGGSIRGLGVCFDVRLSEGDTTDAIQVSLEHTSADPVNVFLPYERQRLQGVKYGELFATPGERRIFS